MIVVVVAGGLTGTTGNLVPTNKAAVYDGNTKTWSATGDMKAARAHHASALKPIAGKVYTSGGYDPVGDTYLNSLAAAVTVGASQGWWCYCLRVGIGVAEKRLDNLL